MEKDLKLLEDPENGNSFIGRKKSLWTKYGYEGALYLGKLEDEETANQLYLDSLNPHVVFVCGARGSGKSYVLGVMAEELVLKNPNVGALAIDPIGVFWSMKHPNKEEREVKALEEWGLGPKGLKKVKVFIPLGARKIAPKETFDEAFSINPALLTAEDWCLTFGIDRFTPSGLLIEKVLAKVKKGYKTVKGDKVKPRPDSYSLEELIKCAEEEEDINSRERGYKRESVRAIVSRFEAAKSWGVFYAEGTPLTELVREGTLTVLDTSFLDDNVTALVIGVIARRVLAARKTSTRREAAKRLASLDMDDLLETDIPPTWLLIDEAHTLIPSGSGTAASNAIIEYVKQGRRPGCSIVFATQQPAAIDSRVLSQLDIIMTHKLVFDDDISAVMKRTPTVVPGRYKKASFVKTLPVGVCLVGDRCEETNRAFIARVRPRMSQHEGRDVASTEAEKALAGEEVEKLCVELVKSKIDREGSAELKAIDKLVENLESRYKVEIGLESVLEELEAKGIEVGEEKAFVKGREPVIEEAEEEIKAGEVFKEKVTAEKAKTVVEKALKAGLLKRKTGKIEKIEKVYVPIARIEYTAMNQNYKPVKRECYLNARTGEFMHLKKGMVSSKGMHYLITAEEAGVNVIKSLLKKCDDVIDISEYTGYGVGKIQKTLDKLMRMGLAKRAKKGKKYVYLLKREIDVPLKALHKLLESFSSLERAEAGMKGKVLEKKYSDEQIKEALEALWEGAAVQDTNIVYLPAYLAVIKTREGRQKLVVEAVKGSLVETQKLLR